MRWTLKSAVALSLALSCSASGVFATESPFAKLDMAPTKEGSYLEDADITKLCGTKPIRVALSEGFTANSWRRTVFAEFQDEAHKCPNIKEILHTDGQGNRALRAFKAAGRPSPLTASEDVNELGCYWQDSRAIDPNFNLITVSSGSWIARLALRQRVAAVEGWTIRSRASSP
jgi:hypothetical protein